jgi:hypothetical protein
VIPKLVRDGEEHFSAVPRLLSEIAREVEVKLIAERGDGAVSIPGVPNVSVLPRSNPVFRMAHLLRHLLAQTRAGSTCFFVRTSQYAALVTALLCKITGGRSYYWHCDAVTYQPLKSWTNFKDWAFSGLAAMLAFKVSDKVVTAPESMRDCRPRKFSSYRMTLTSRDFGRSHQTSRAKFEASWGCRAGGSQ